MINSQVFYVLTGWNSLSIDAAAALSIDLLPKASEQDVVVNILGVLHTVWLLDVLIVL